MLEQNDKLEFINALKNDFATTVRKTYINSLKQEVGFREVTVLEQKQLSRIMIDNEDRKDVVYDAQCALINKTCLNDGFDIYNLSEFDKLKLTICMYQTNMYKNEIKFKCKKCGTENSYKLNFKNAIARLDKMELNDGTFVFENDSWKFTFTINYPTVKKVSQLYKTYNIAFSNIYEIKDKNAKEKALASLDESVNIDYICMYAKKIEIYNKISQKTTTIDSNDFTAKEISQIFSTFPQDVLYTDDGILTYVTKNFIDVINQVYDTHRCGACGEVYEEAPDTSTQNFF